jgi:hypothetical protein
MLQPFGDSYAVEAQTIVISEQEKEILLKHITQETLTGTLKQFKSRPLNT